jgi:hypothetical protein
MLHKGFLAIAAILSPWFLNIVGVRLQNDGNPKIISCVITYQLDSGENLDDLSDFEVTAVQSINECAYICFEKACKVAAYEPHVEGNRGVCKTFQRGPNGCVDGQKRHYTFYTKETVLLSCVKCDPNIPHQANQSFVKQMFVMPDELKDGATVNPVLLEPEDEDEDGGGVGDDALEEEISPFAAGVKNIGVGKEKLRKSAKKLKKSKSKKLKTTTELPLTTESINETSLDTTVVTDKLEIDEKLETKVPELNETTEKPQETTETSETKRSRKRFRVKSTTPILSDVESTTPSLSEAESTTTLAPETTNLSDIEITTTLAPETTKSEDFTTQEPTNEVTKKRRRTKSRKLTTLKSEEERTTEAITLEPITETTTL